MTYLCLILLAISLIRAALKGYEVWGDARDVYDPGPLPALDFVLLCPLPIAFGTGLLLSAMGQQVFLETGLVIYVALAVAFWCLHAWFERSGRPERQRLLDDIRRQQEQQAAAKALAVAAPATEPTGRQEPRERLFFWLGVFVLPVFWSWFTLGRAFTRSERVVAFSWLALTACWMAWQWQSLAEHWTFVSIGHPIIAGWLTFSLLGWLCYRLGMRLPTLFEFVMLVFVFGPYFLHLMDPFYFAVGKPFSAFWLLPPLVLALLHLMLEPVKRWVSTPRALRECAENPPGR